MSRLRIGSAVLVVIAIGVMANTSLAVPGFLGPYDPINWTFSDGGGNGMVMTNNAPESISLWGDDGGTAAIAQYTVPVPADGTIHFDWDYSTGDSALFDPFGYVLDGSFVELTDSGGANDQAGSAGVDVSQSQTFGFYAQAIDSLGPGGHAEITKFDAPHPVPEPLTASLSLMGLGALGLATRRRRQA